MFVNQMSDIIGMWFKTFKGTTQIVVGNHNRHFSLFTALEVKQLINALTEKAQMNQ